MWGILGCPGTEPNIDIKGDMKNFQKSDSLGTSAYLALH